MFDKRVNDKDMFNKKKFKYGTVDLRMFFEGIFEKVIFNKGKFC